MEQNASILAENVAKQKESLADFHLPKWDELPCIPLYLQQVLQFLDDCLGVYLLDESGEEALKQHVMTRMMINNYVKLRFIRAPEKKRYDREQIASLMIIAILKSVYSIEEISVFIQLALAYASAQTAYEQFCRSMEEAVSHAFQRTTMEKPKNPGDPRDLFWNVCNSVACRLYVKKTYLQRPQWQE